jgi:hypothetical protein
VSNGHRALALALLLGATGCNDVPGRRQFLPIPSPVTVPAGSLVVDGPTAMEPGGAARFTATFIGDDGTRRDVTREAQWSLSGFGIVMPEPGVAIAEDVGFVRVFVSFGAAYTQRDLSARPAGTFVVQGRVSPLIVVARARVDVLDGMAAGRSVTTDTFGHYVLVGVAGPLRMRVSMLGQATEERSLVVADDLEVDFSLTARPTRDPVGRWLLTVHASAECSPSFGSASTMVEISKNAAPSTLNYSITVPGAPSLPAFRATVQHSVFSAALYLGDPNWDDVVIGVPLGESAEVWGTALGEIGENRVSGAIEGVFTDRRANPYMTCHGTHLFDMRPQ